MNSKGVYQLSLPYSSSSSAVQQQQDAAAGVSCIRLPSVKKGGFILLKPPQQASEVPRFDFCAHMSRGGGSHRFWNFRFFFDFVTKVSGLSKETLRWIRRTCSAGMMYHFDVKIWFLSTHRPERTRHIFEYPGWATTSGIDSRSKALQTSFLTSDSLTSESSTWWSKKFWFLQWMKLVERLIKNCEWRSGHTSYKIYFVCVSLSVRY